MGKVLLEEQNLIDIANSIRNKTDSNETMIPSEMSTNIDNIRVGGNNLKNDEVEFIFNPQYKIDESNFTITNDKTPNSSKTYYVKKDDEIVVEGVITSFKVGVTYYEKSSTYDAITGECSIVRYKDKVIMIDTGATNRKEEIKKHLQKNNVNKVDYLIISHYHYDHCANFVNMCEYIDFTECKCYLPLVAPNLGEQENVNFINKVDSLGLEKIYPNDNDELIVENLKIKFYNCGEVAFNELNALTTKRKVNDYSMVCLFTYLNTNILFSGDIEYIAQERLTSKKYFENIKIDLYKWHHHGYNSIDNCYHDYLRQIKPLNIVVVSQEFFSCNNDIQLLNLNESNYVYKNQIKYISNGFSVDLEKENTDLEIKEFKNICFHTNSGTPLNSYREFMKFKLNTQWKAINLLFHISEQNGGRFSGLFSIDIYLGNSKEDLKINIENIGVNSAGGYNTFNILNDLYVAYDDEFFHIYFKKTNNYIATTISLLNIHGYGSAYSLYPSMDLLTEEEFISKYGDNFYKYTEWKQLDFDSNYVDIFNTQSTASYRKVGNVVEIEATFKNKVGISDQVIATIPVGYRPQFQKDFVCQTSNNYRFDCTITPSGNITINRYSGVDGTTEIPVGSWIKINVIYTI